MDREELLAFLRDNLTIEIETDENNWDGVVHIKARLYLDGEPISSAQDSFALPSAS